METQTIQILEKSKIAKPVKNESACCGGTPVNNENACCKLDEEKKTEGESGCGCNTPAVEKENSTCC
jgi:hypothetical protein